MKYVKYEKEKLTDIQVTEDVDGGELRQRDIQKMYAVKKVFRDVDFSQVDFSKCYIRKCKFINCNFTGAVFRDCNFRGTTFESCRFDYVIWDKTILEQAVLDQLKRDRVNVDRDVIRALRTNFAQIGNYSAVNQAAAMEVDLTGEYLFRAGWSKDSYYKQKHSKLQRLGFKLQHVTWRAMHYIWGNGERPLNVVVSAVMIVLAVAVWRFVSGEDRSMSVAFWQSFYHFWGVDTGQLLEPAETAILTIARYILVALFMAASIRRISRR